MKIELKNLAKEDLEYRVFLLNHKRIVPYINSNEVFTIEKTLKWYFKISNSESRRDFVFIRKNNKIGMGGLTNISISNKHCELYMYLDPNHQGIGLGYLSCKALCSFAFNDLKMEKIILYTFSNNKRANKLYEKIGFKLEGILRKHTFKLGELQDRNIYGLLKLELK